MPASILLSRLKNFDVDSKIDVRDTEYVWCIGRIKAVVSFPRSPKYIYVHYEGWDKIFDEYFSEHSERIAPLGFFTNRKDIPRYILSGNGNCRLGLIVSSAEEMDRVNESIQNSGGSRYQRAIEALVSSQSIPLFLNDTNIDPENGIDLNSQNEE